MTEEVKVRLPVEETADRMFGRNRGSGPGLYAGQADPDPASAASEAVSIGEAFTKSEAYRIWRARFPSPDSGPRGSVMGDQVLVRIGISQLLDGARGLISSADAVAGSLVAPHFAGLMGPGLVRPLTLRGLVTTIPTSSDTVQYAREVSRESDAAPVAEASAITGTTGTKPEGGLIFELITEPVRTIALHVPATTRIVADAPQLRAYIDQYLSEDLEIELEDQMVAGSGAGENFRGILNTPGIGTVDAPVAPAGPLDNLRKGKRTVRVNGKTNATAVLLNPEDTERIDLLRINDEAHHFAGGALIPGGGGPFGVTPGTVWGLPIVETEAVPVNTAVVGDFRRAILFDRQAVTISLGTIDDDFVRNIVRVLAELRGGFGVIRPAAFVAVTLS